MAKNIIKVDPVPDINTHDFTIYALNEVYNNEFLLHKEIKKANRSSGIKFFLLTAVCGYLYTKIRELEETVKNK